MNDLRVYSGAFQAYTQEHGDWPPGGGAPGVFPPGMEGYLNQTNWSRTTPIGGNYQFATQSPQAGAATLAVIIIATVGNNAVTSGTSTSSPTSTANLTTGIWPPEIFFSGTATIRYLSWNTRCTE